MRPARSSARRPWLAALRHQTAMANSDQAYAGVAMVGALGKAMLSLVQDETQLYEEYADTVDCKKWFEDQVFRATYRKSA